jgi:hypothetical protein
MNITLTIPDGTGRRSSRTLTDAVIPTPEWLALARRVHQSLPRGMAEMGGTRIWRQVGNANG